MKNSVAIVTGASQGIGRSTAIRLARDFSAVVLAARNGEALEAVADAVKAAGAEPRSPSAATACRSAIPMAPG
jgi:3-oxoacyl-[acyl-carrier protein] reductase